MLINLSLFSGGQNAHNLVLCRIVSAHRVNASLCYKTTFFFITPYARLFEAHDTHMFLYLAS